MEWNDALSWWMLSGLLVLAELLTGTFYLLMLALGTAAAALAAYVGASEAAQMMAGALVGASAVLACYLLRRRRRREAEADLNIDIGSPVVVTSWRDDGTARVRYRGSDWDARFAGHGEPNPGKHIIRAIQGSVLLLGPGAR